MFCSRASSISVAEGWHHTSSSKYASRRASMQTSCFSASSGIIPTSHYQAVSCQQISWLLWVHRAGFLICCYYRVKNKPRDVHTTPHTVFAWPVGVSHVFPHLGCFLPNGRHIKEHTVFNNFVRWLNVMSCRCYFNLSQLFGITEARSSGDLPLWYC